MAVRASANAFLPALNECRSQSWAWALRGRLKPQFGSSDAPHIEHQLNTSQASRVGYVFKFAGSRKHILQYMEPIKLSFLRFDFPQARIPPFILYFPPLLYHLIPVVNVVTVCVAFLYIIYLAWPRQDTAILAIEPLLSLIKPLNSQASRSVWCVSAVSRMSELIAVAGGAELSEKVALILILVVGHYIIISTFFAVQTILSD
jgi:hypothetical protein